MAAFLSAGPYTTASSNPLAGKRTDRLKKMLATAEESVQKELLSFKYPDTQGRCDRYGQRPVIDPKFLECKAEGTRIGQPFAEDVPELLESLTPYMENEQDRRPDLFTNKDKLHFECIRLKVRLSDSGKWVLQL